MHVKESRSVAVLSAQCSCAVQSCIPIGNHWTKRGSKEHNASPNRKPVRDTKIIFRVEVRKRGKALEALEEERRTMDAIETIQTMKL